MVNGLMNVTEKAKFIHVVPWNKQYTRHGESNIQNNIIVNIS
jgi:hypothetical protein